MQIRIKLMGILQECTPAGGMLDLSDGATIDDVLRTLDIPIDSVQVFTINGQLVLDRAHRLHEGDQLTAIPPVAGG